MFKFLVMYIDNILLFILLVNIINPNPNPNPNPDPNPNPNPNPDP